MSKTGVQGKMLMIVPLMAMAFGAKESTGVILPMLCMADIIAVAYYKRIADWRIVAKAFRRFIQIVTVISVIMMII